MGKAKTAVSNAVQAQFNGAGLEVFSSLKDMAYKQAQTGDRLRNQAQYALERIAGFPESCPDEARAELNSGYVLRFADNHPEVSYAKIDGNYILVTDENAMQFAGKETVRMNASIAMGYTTHAFGKLSETHDPQYKAIVKQWRDDVSDYCSGCFKALKTAALKIVNAGKTRNRGATLNFDVKVKKIFDDLAVNVRNASKRGDPSADEKRFAKAKIAFFTVWNHAE